MTRLKCFVQKGRGVPGSISSVRHRSAGSPFAKMRFLLGYCQPLSWTNRQSTSIVPDNLSRRHRCSCKRQACLRTNRRPKVSGLSAPSSTTVRERKSGRRRWVDPVISGAAARSTRFLNRSVCSLHGSEEIEKGNASAGLSASTTSENATRVHSRNGAHGELGLLLPGFRSRGSLFKSGNLAFEYADIASLPLCRVMGGSIL